MLLNLRTTPDRQPDYLRFPLDRPLESWDDPSLVRIPVGVHRHVVRFVDVEGRLYALKELPRRLAAREWRNLRYLTEEGLPAVDVLGVISERGDELDDILVTRHLEFSMPFRFLFARSGLSRLQESLIDSIAVLLVRLHLHGFWWGDCSLSNTLFRRDAGALSAWLVDTETGELHDQLTDGQRALELDIAEQNVAGGLLDLQASGRLSADVDPVDIVDKLRERYGQLWAELTVEQTMDVDDRYLIDQRLARLNDLGFDATEIKLVATDGGTAVRFRPVVVEAGHHMRMLKALTGIDALENQARRLVNDLRSYGAWLSDQEGRQLPEAVIGYRWLTEVFEPAIEAVPVDLRDRREPPELFHEILHYRDVLAERGGERLRVPEAAVSYAATALPHVATERALVGEEAEALVGQAEDPSPPPSGE